MDKFFKFLNSCYMADVSYKDMYDSKILEAINH